MRVSRNWLVLGSLSISGCLLGAEEAPRKDPSVAVHRQGQNASSESYLWTRRGEEVLRRLEPALIDQPNRGRVLMYGGWTTDGVLADTWEWDGVGWSRRLPKDNPGPRMSVSTAYDPSQSRVLLLGGFSAAAPGLELAPPGMWEWTGGNWGRVITPNTPSARVGASMAWDDANHCAWLFGGGTTVVIEGRKQTAVTTDELWRFDGTDWALIPKSGNWPSPRTTAAIVWDADKGRVLLHGGYENLGIDDGYITTDPAGYRHDTWEWNGTAWTQWAADPAMASEQGASTLAYDALTKNVYLGVEYPFALGATNTATLYRAEGSAWVEGPKRGPVDIDFDPADPTAKPTPGSLVFAKGAWSSANHGILAVSGFELQPPSSYLGTLHQHDWLATWDGGYQRYDATLLLESQASGSAVELGGRAYLFGGLRGGTIVDAFYVWDGGRWAPVQRKAADAWPVPRRDGQLAPLGTDKLVLFGGRSGGGVLGDTWVWTRTNPTGTTGTWAQLDAEALAPSARYGGAFAAVGEQLVLFGGGTSSTQVADTWQFDGAAWQELHPASAPPARRGSLFASTADGGLRVFGGGVEEPGKTTVILSDLWDFRIEAGAPTWTPLSANEDTRRRRGGMATDRATGRTLLYGGTGDNARSEVYDFTTTPGIPFTGTVREEDQPRPRRRYLEAFAANPTTGGILSFGGFSTDSDLQLDDTWLLQRFGASCTQNTECGPGQFCTEGVCCESAACGPCNTCAAAGHVGTCSPRGTYGPQPGCDAAGRACSADGHCRLADQGRCTENEACASGTCLNGESGTGVCCTAAGCAVRCVEGSNELQTPDGSKISCGAYGCAVDHCIQTCQTLNDCVEGAVCNEQHQCILPEAPPAADDGGCSCHTAPTSSDHGVAALALLALTYLRRRLGAK